MDKYNSKIQKSLFLWLTQLGVALLYLIFGVVIHQSFTVHSIVAVIWPGSGLALAAMLIGGKRYIWGVFLGSLTLNIVSNNSLWAIGGITLANSLEALMGFWLLTRNSQPTKSLHTLADYLRLILLGGAVSGIAGAVIGSLSILLAGYINLANLTENVFHWWMGDALGVSLLTPFILSWRQEWLNKFSMRRTFEGLLLIGLTFFVGQIVFFDWFHEYFTDSPRSYLLFLCVSGVAIRIGTRGTTLVLLMIAIQALIGAYHGVGIFAHDIAKANLQNYWGYILTLSIVGLAITTNVNEIKRAFDTEHESRQRYRMLFDTNPMPMWVFEEGSLKFLRVNDRAVEHYGYTREEFSRMTLRDVRPMEDYPEFDRLVSRFAGEKVTGERRHKTKDGSIIHVSISAKPIMYGHTPAKIALIQDITERKLSEEKLQKSEASLRAILDNVPYLIWLKDMDGRFIAVNKAFFSTTGRASMDEVLGKTDFDFWPREIAEKYHAADTEIISSRQHKIMEEMSLDKGEVHWVETFKAPILDQNGNVLGTTGFARNITKQKQSENQVHRMAHYDSLTDLPNRSLLSDRLQQAILIARREKKLLAVMFIDLDKFKPINDELGHYVGDLLLKEVAKRMQDCVRESDTVARIGGDEFIVLLPNIAAEQNAIMVAEKIRLSLNQPFMLVGHSLNITSSTGIAIYPEHGEDELQLVKNADTAMYVAKVGGRNDVKLYQPGIQGS